MVFKALSSFNPQALSLPHVGIDRKSGTVARNQLADINSQPRRNFVEKGKRKILLSRFALHVFFSCHFHDLSHFIGRNAHILPQSSDSFGNLHNSVSHYVILLHISFFSLPGPCCIHNIKKPIPTVFLLLGRAYNSWYHPISAFIKSPPVRFHQTLAYNAAYAVSYCALRILNSGMITIEPTCLFTPATGSLKSHWKL